MLCLGGLNATPPRDRTEWTSMSSEYFWWLCCWTRSRLTKWNVSCIIKWPTEGWQWHQKQMKSLYCAANKLLGTFAQCSTAVKNNIPRLLHTNVRGRDATIYRTTVYRTRHTCQLWIKYTETSDELTNYLQQCLPNFALHTQKCKCSPTPG